MEKKNKRKEKWKDRVLKSEVGIDGILVTVGLCIIALLLCVVMKDSLSSFITTLVESMTTKAQQILTGVAGCIFTRGIG